MGIINSQTLKEFQKELGSKRPTPAGGVVSALSGAFAASLIEMVCNLTLEKENYRKVKKDVIKIHKDAIELKKRLTNLAEEDKKAYDKVILAYRKKDKEQIKKALKYAIEVPFEVRKISPAPNSSTVFAQLTGSFPVASLPYPVITSYLSLLRFSFFHTPAV